MIDYTLKKVAILGSPKMGKLETVIQWSKIVNKKVTNYEYEKEYIWTLDFVRNNCKIVINTTTSNIFYEYKTYSHLLENTNLVLYFLPSEVLDKESQEIQEMRFEMISRIAKRLNKAWNDIPWIIVKRVFRNNLVDTPMIPFSMDFLGETPCEIVTIKHSFYGDKQTITELEWFSGKRYDVEYEGLDILLNNVIAKLSK